MKVAVCVKHVPEGSPRLDPGSRWGQVVGNVLSEWLQVLGLVLMTKKLFERGSEESN